MAGVINPAGDGIRRGRKTITFDGTAGKGAIGNVIWFTVTGAVLIEYIVGLTEATLVGATATITLGVENLTNRFIAATLATLLAAGTIWVDTGPDADAIALTAALKQIVMIASSAGANDIASAVATAAITGGALRIEVGYRPLSDDGKIVPT